MKKMILLISLFLCVKESESSLKTEMPYNALTHKDRGQLCFILEQKIKEEIYRLPFAARSFDSYIPWSQMKELEQIAFCQQISEKRTNRIDYKGFLSLEDKYKEELCKKFEIDNDITIYYNELANSPSYSAIWRNMTFQERLNSCELVYGIEKHRKRMFGKIKGGGGDMREEFINSERSQRVLNGLINKFDELKRRSTFDRIFDSAKYTFSGGLMGEKELCDVKEICNENSSIYERFKGFLHSFQLMKNEDKEKSIKFANDSIQFLEGVREGQQR